MTKTLSIFLLLLPICRLEAVSVAAPKEAGTEKARECLRKAFEAARLVKQLPTKRLLLEEIGQDLACAGDCDSARQAVAETDDPKGAAMILAAIGLTQAKRGQRDAAKTTLGEALKKSEHVNPDDRRFALHGIVEGHLAAGQFAEALEVAVQFENQTNQLYAYTAIVKAYMAAGRREEAKSLLSKVSGKFLSKWPQDGFEMIHWEDVCALYLELDDVAGALNMARIIPKEYYGYCRALCAVGEHQAKKGSAAAAAATLEDAFRAAQEIEGGNPVRENHMGWVVRAHLGGGDLGGAIKTLQLMPDCYHKAGAFEAVAETQAKAGDRTAARATLEQAVRMAERKLTEDAYLEAEALASLAEQQANIGENTTANDTVARAVRALQQVNVDSVALGSGAVAKAQVRLGDRSSAEKTLAEAVRKVRTITDVADRAHEAEYVAKAQIALGFNDAALATMREIVLPLLPLPDPQPDGRDEAASLLGRAGDLAGGYKLAQQIQEGIDFRASATRSVAAYHVIAKGPDEALALAEKEKDAALRSSLYHGIALTLLKADGIEAPTFWLVDPQSWLWSAAD